MADRDLVLDAIGNASVYNAVLALVAKVPKLRVILDHLPLDGANAALREIGGMPQVFAKVSGVLRKVDARVPEDPAFYRASLDTLWTTFGPDRLVYGSNWPVSDRMAPYATVLNVVRAYFDAKAAAASEKYFRTNSLRFYKWVDRG